MTKGFRTVPSAHYSIVGGAHGIVEIINNELKNGKLSSVSFFLVSLLSFFFGYLALVDKDTTGYGD